MDIHNKYVKMTPEVSFEIHYREKVESNKRKKLSTIASKVAENQPEVAVLLYSILIGLCNPKKKSFVKYLTARSILLQRIGNLSASKRDNDVLFHSRFVHTNYFLAQSELLEKIGQRDKSLEVLNFGLFFHPNNTLLTQRIEKLSKKKIRGEGKISRCKNDFFKLPSFLIHECKYGKHAKPFKKGTSLINIPKDTLEFEILPYLDNLDLVKLSQTCFDLRNFISTYYQRKHGTLFRDFIREEFKAKNKVREFFEFANYYDRLTSYCLRIQTLINDELVKDAGQYSVYCQQLNDNEPFIDDKAVAPNRDETSKVTEKVFQSVCIEAKEFYLNCNGFRKESSNYKNLEFYHRQLVDTLQEKEDAVVRGVGVLPGFDPLQNINEYRKKVADEEGANMKITKNTKFLVFLNWDVDKLFYDKYTFNFVLDSKTKDVSLEGWIRNPYSPGMTNRNFGRFGSFYATLNWSNYNVSRTLAFMVNKIIDNVHLLMKK